MHACHLPPRNRTRETLSLVFGDREVPTAGQDDTSRDRALVWDAQGPQEASSLPSLTAGSGQIPRPRTLPSPDGHVFPSSSALCPSRSHGHTPSRAARFLSYSQGLGGGCAWRGVLCHLDLLGVCISGSKVLSKSVSESVRW